MAGQVVQMDYQVVGDVSKGFNTAAQTLSVIAKVLDALIQILRAMAFASLGTSLALANYLDVIKGKINNLVKICTEFAQDLAIAIKAHQDGDIKGRKFFGEGVTR
jgi:hypothetical protein